MPGPIIASEPSFACICPHRGRHGAARPPRLGAPAGGRRDRPGDTPQPGVLEPVRVRAGVEHNPPVIPRSRDVPCPCSWTRSASGAGAAVRVGRLRPRGVVSAATAACRDRIRLPTRALSLRRDPSLVAHGRSSSSSPPLAAATCPCRPCDPLFQPPAPPHHPCVMERRCPAAGGVKHARGGVRQGVITHHRLCRPAPMMAKDLHPPHVLVWLLEPRECVCAAYICPT